MRTLLIGSGGREHALAWKLAQSPKLTKLFIAPGNGGTAIEGENVDLDPTDHQAIIDFCKQQAIEFVVVGPDAQVVAGLGDDVRAAGIPCFSPSRDAGQLEGSKTFTKILCNAMGIPTAHYRAFDNAEDAIEHVRKVGAPIVVKMDGLALGKGVTVAETVEEAERAVHACFAGVETGAEASVVIEECLFGEEASLFVLCDGINTLPLATAQDHKRVGDGDTGPNTGGMGAYSPAPVMTDELTDRAMREIIAPTVSGLAARGTPYQGVLYAGLMITKDGPKLIEYNARFGDPECQVLFMRLKSDLLDLLYATATGNLVGKAAEWRPEAALTVIMATKGYPGAYDKGSAINGLDALNSDTVQVFHAGTKRSDTGYTANGGRVLNVTALGANVTEAQARAYEAVDRIDWPEGFCRRDIGWRAVERENS